jgi:hypothetical protein
VFVDGTCIPIQFKCFWFQLSELSFMLLLFVYVLFNLVAIINVFLYLLINNTLACYLYLPKLTSSPLSAVATALNGDDSTGRLL